MFFELSSPREAGASRSTKILVIPAKAGIYCEAIPGQARDDKDKEQINRFNPCSTVISHNRHIAFIKLSRGRAKLQGSNQQKGYNMGRGRGGQGNGTRPPREKTKEQGKFSLSPRETLNRILDKEAVKERTEKPWS